MKILLFRAQIFKIFSWYLFDYFYININLFQTFSNISNYIHSIQFTNMYPDISFLKLNNFEHEFIIISHILVYN